MNQVLEQYALDTQEELKQLIRDLAPIPAPSWHEEKRVEWIKAWMERQGAEGVFVDEQKNVIWPYNVTEDNDLLVFMAHTDVVFPDMTELPYKEDDEFMWCPGIGDDTTRLAQTLIAARYFIQNAKKTKNGLGILFIANSCEEGLGNSMGAYTVLKNYGKRVKFFISNDGVIGSLVNVAVGSHRYEVEVTTPGGHSYGAFGKKNALYELSDLLHELYQVELPVKLGKKTTFNVGKIEGGTSVNTIAQKATMLFEYRSDDRECLQYMQDYFEKTVEKQRRKYTEEDGVNIKVTLLGARPCNGDTDVEKQRAFEQLHIDALKESLDMETKFKSASTDSNYPLSYGIPAFTIGTCVGIGAHTREEHIVKASLLPGMKYLMTLLSKFFEE